MYSPRRCVPPRVSLDSNRLSRSMSPSQRSSCWLFQSLHPESLPGRLGVPDRIPLRLLLARLRERPPAGSARSNTHDRSLRLASVRPPQAVALLDQLRPAPALRLRLVASPSGEGRSSCLRTCRYRLATF